MIQYSLPNNITLLVTVNKFDPNPILVNINKLKTQWFQDTSASRRLESIVEKGRDTTNIEIRFNITTLENAQGTDTKFSLLVDGTEIQELRLGTKNLDSVVLTKIWNTPIQTKNMEDPIGTKIYTIGSSIENILLIKNSCSRIKIQNSKWITKILDSRSLRESTKIVELVTIGQILDSKYLVADSSIVKSIVKVVDGKSMD